MGSIAIVQDRARDLSYLGWRLTPIYDPDPLSEGVEGIEDDTALLEEQGVRACNLSKESLSSGGGGVDMLYFFIVYLRGVI